MVAGVWVPLTPEPTAWACTRFATCERVPDFAVRERAGLQSIHRNDLARFGAESKAVITGDHTQIDLPANKRSGLVEAMGALQTIEGIDFATSANAT